MLLLLLLLLLILPLTLKTADATCAFTHALVSTHSFSTFLRYVLGQEFQACQLQGLDSGRTAYDYDGKN